MEVIITGHNKKLLKKNEPLNNQSHAITKIKTIAA